MTRDDCKEFAESIGKKINSNMMDTYSSGGWPKDVLYANSNGTKDVYFNKSGNNNCSKSRGPCVKKTNVRLSRNLDGKVYSWEQANAYCQENGFNLCGAEDYKKNGLMYNKAFMNFI